MGNEYDVCKDARFALERFIKGVSIDQVLATHPLPYFTFHIIGVWQVVFEGYPEAIRALDRIGLYSAFTTKQEMVLKQPESDAIASVVVGTALAILERKVEYPEHGLTTEETALIIRDCFDHQILLKAMCDEAQINLDRRVSIDAAYNPEFRNPEWVGWARKVKEVVDRLFSKS